MAKRGQNVNNVKQSNRSLLLNLLYFGSAQSRKSLAQKSGLTAAAITTLIYELLEDGAVVETEKIFVEGKLGRNEQLIDINYKALFVVGINFGIETFEVMLVRLDSKVLYSKEFEILSTDISNFGEDLADIIITIINEFTIAAESVVGIGITVRGIVDSKNGISINSYGVLANSLNIKDQLKDKLSFPVIVENNVRSMLRADIILRHAKVSQSTLLIKYGPGVGGALIVGEKSYLGSSCHALELGHVCIEAEGNKCICGKRGCLETIVSYDAIIRKAREIFSFEQTPVLFSLCKADNINLTIQTIFSAYEKDDKGIEDIFVEIIKYFGLSIANYTSLFDPEVVLLVSEVFKCKKFIDSLQKAIISFSGSHKPKYIIISDSHKLDKYGASSVAVNDFLATGAQILKDKRITGTDVLYD